jgi:phosphatidylinositol-3-phosphatase
VPFNQLAKDLMNNDLPDFCLIIPNLNNDGHDGSPGKADAWLRMNIKPLVDNAEFKRDGILIITFDESDGDNVHGGGHIATVLVGPNVRAGCTDSSFHQHESILRTVEAALQLPSLKAVDGVTGLGVCF